MTEKKAKKKDKIEKDTEKDEKADKAKLVPVEVAGVFFAGSPVIGGQPVVFLSRDGKWLPIYIGIGEAISIDMALRGETTPRPMTHDLMLTAITALGGTVEKTVVDRLDDQVYYAKLYLNTFRGIAGEAVLDARPSDCVALAIRAGARVLVDEAVFNENAMPKEDIHNASEEFVRMTGKRKDFNYRP